MGGSVLNLCIITRSEILGTAEWHVMILLLIRTVITFCPGYKWSGQTNYDNINGPP